MTKRYSIAEAWDHLGEMVQEVEAGNTVELARDNRPVAVLLPFEEYERITERKPGFWDSYQELRREFGFDEIAIDPASVFGDIREQSPGRGFSPAAVDARRGSSPGGIGGIDASPT